MPIDILLPEAEITDENRGRILTEREVQMIELVVEGQTNKEIAAHVGISEETIKRHISNIFDKVGVGTAGTVVGGAAALFGAAESNGGAGGALQGAMGGAEIGALAGPVGMVTPTFISTRSTPRPGWTS